MSWMMGWIWESEYIDWVKREKKERRPASVRGIEECVKCGWCCCLRTCVPRSEELERIAGFLRMSVAEMIRKYMVGDKMQGHTFLRFANTAQASITGKFLSARNTYDQGECLLFENGVGCKIHPVRPRDAAEMECWVKKDGEPYEAIKSWPEGKLLEICPGMDLSVDDPSDDYEEDSNE